MPYKKRQKRLDYMRAWNKKNYIINRDKEKVRIQKRKKEIALWFGSYKETLSCQYCGEVESVCLDFHHRLPKSKDLNISLVKGWGWGKKRILSEVKKCIVLCANCHRKLHAGIIDLN